MRPSVQQPISKDKNVIARARKYYLKQLFDLEVKVPRRSLRYATHHLMVMHPHTKYHWPISKDKNVMAQTRKYYLQNNYLTLRSKVKVPRRSLRYATHCLMVMHPHTKYHWPIWKDKSYGPDKLRWEAEEKIRLKQYVSLRSNYSDLKSFDNLAECFCDSPLPSMFLVIRNIRYKMTANIEQSFNLGVYCRRIFLSC
jgi:hypothetical protein